MCGLVVLYHFINSGQNLGFSEVNGIFATGLTGVGLSSTIFKKWVYSLKRHKGESKKGFFPLQTKKVTISTNG